MLEGSMGWKGYYYYMNHTFSGGLLPVVIIAAVCSVIGLVLQWKRDKERDMKISKYVQTAAAAGMTKTVLWQ